MVLVDYMSTMYLRLSQLDRLKSNVIIICIKLVLRFGAKSRRKLYRSLHEYSGLACAFFWDSWAG